MEPLTKCLWKPRCAGHCLDRASALTSGPRSHNGSAGTVLLLQLWVQGKLKKFFKNKIPAKIRSNKKEILQVLLLQANRDKIPRTGQQHFWWILSVPGLGAEKFCCSSMVILFVVCQTGQRHFRDVAWNLPQLVAFSVSPLPLSLLQGGGIQRGSISGLMPSGAHKHPFSIPPQEFRISNPSTAFSSIQGEWMLSSFQDFVLSLSPHCQSPRAAEWGLSWLKGEQDKAQMLSFTVVPKTSPTTS